MIGYLTVLPDSAYTGEAVNRRATRRPSPQTTTVAMVQGSGANASIAQQSYSPSPVTVVIGVNNTVTWANDDSAPHTVTANDGSFNSGNMAPTGPSPSPSRSQGPTSITAIYHPWMVGTIIVKGA